MPQNQHGNDNSMLKCYTYCSTCNVARRTALRLTAYAKHNLHKHLPAQLISYWIFTKCQMFTYIASCLIFLSTP